MANYAADVVTEQGITMTVRTSSASDTIPGGVILDVNNTGGTASVVTIVTPKVISGDLALADRTVTVPITTGQKSVYIPNNDTYVDQTTGLVTLQFSVSGASVTYTVTKLTS